MQLGCSQDAMGSSREAAGMQLGCSCMQQDAEWMQHGCSTDAAGMQLGCSRDAAGMQLGCSWDAVGCSWDAAGMQWDAAGKHLGENFLNLTEPCVPLFPRNIRSEVGGGHRGVIWNP